MNRRAEARNRRPDARNVHAPEGMHWCSAGHYELKEMFVKNAAKAGGLHNRCRAHEREYRKQLEAKAGKRSQITKTLRVDNETHRWVHLRKGGTSTAKFLREAISFYLSNVCVEPGCSQVGLRGNQGRCARCERT